MNINITFRHLEPSEAIKKYVERKVGRIQKFLRQPMTAKVTLSLDKLRHTAEVRIASGGERLEASETSERLYASIDMVVDKLERQVRVSKGTTQAKERRAAARIAPSAETTTAKKAALKKTATPKKAVAKKTATAKKAGTKQAATPKKAAGKPSSTKG